MKKLIYTLVILAFAVSLNAQWVLSNTGLTAGTISQISFVDLNTGYVFVQNLPNNFIFKTTDASSTWSQVYNITGDTINTLCFINASTGFAGGRGKKIYTTINGGLNWNSQTFSNIVNKGIKKIKFVNATTGFAVGDGLPEGPIIKTTNGGTNWNAINSGASSFLNDIFFVDTNTGYVCGDFDIMKSTNGGESWSMLFHGVSGDPEYWSLYFVNANTGYFSHSQRGYKVTTNGGTSFSNVVLDTTLGVVFSCVNFTDVNTGYLTSFNMTNYNGRGYKTTNGGANWAIQMNFTGIPLFSVLFLTSSTGYIAGYGSPQALLYKTTSGGVSVQNISTEVPSAYSLLQNYPNPFNPRTVVRFSLSVVGLTTLKVYDMMGREVQTLVNERLQAGTYEALFDGSKLSSGTYFYKLTAGDFTATKKLTLIK
jgi:photosystem II stability/assembly factor-like uncharacterized protein